MVERPPSWFFAAVAVCLMAVAFALGQWAQGAGAVFIAAVTPVWCVYAHGKWGARRRG